MDLAPGVTTPGWFDLRPVVDKMPWPDLVGKRCLDIGTYDGYLAFEMEKRGAAEVHAIDIEDHDLWDWPPDARPSVVGRDVRTAGFRGPKKGDGFRLASKILDSKVQWHAVSIYDLNPELLGMFDVITIGTLLLHLRDPVGALEAVRSVCAGHLMSSEQIELWLSIAHRGRPIYRLNGSGQDCQWWLANARGHWQLLYSAGFEIEKQSKPYIVEFNVHPKPQRTPFHLVRRAVLRVLAGTANPGIFHRALLARPRV
jgi:tRNA (mo5U34)-methyltransferase